jgi:PadR family transcriptional regulator, regulatory protein PadR
MAPLSSQSTSVLMALATEPSAWRHGYDLAKQTGLKSGSLYPILIRFAERGLIEAEWEREQPQGRPRRHLYRITAAGLAAAAAAGDVRTTQVSRRRPGPSIAIEGAS